MNKLSLLEKEQTLVKYTAGVFVVVVISSVFSFVLPQFGVWQQAVLLVHILLGLPFACVLLYYTYLHIYRTVGQRRFGMIGTGLIISLVILAVLGSGLVLLFYGMQEAYAYMHGSHVVFGLILVVLSVVHMVLHSLTLSKKRQHQGRTFLSAAALSSRALLIPLLVCVGIVVLFVAVHYSLGNYSQESRLVNYSYAYGDHPFRPSQTESYHGQFLDQRELSNSQECANCHQEIYAQWHSSVHRQAASDITYQTNINLLVKKKGIAAARYCEGCHAPIALLTGELTPGGTHGGMTETVAHQEGVSCLSCHSIDRAVHTKGVGSYRIGERLPHLFDKTDTLGLNQLNRLLMQTKPERHKQNMAKPVLIKPEHCATCHAQFMDKEMNHWGWVKMQDEYQAWLDSPFSAGADQNKQHHEVQTCQDCHMPLVAAADPSANDQGKVRSHRFLGANTMLPLINGDQEHLNQTVAFLQQEKMRVEIDIPDRQDIIETSQVLNQQLRQRQETPDFFYLGEMPQIRVVVSNIGVGHNFPGGTTDINEVWLAFSVFDATGAVVYESGHLQSDKRVDPNAYFYRSIPIDRQGNQVWRHDLFNKTGESFRRVIKAGQSDIVDMQFSVPGWVESPLTLVASLNYRKLNLRYAQWAMGDTYQALPVVRVAYDSKQVPIKLKPPIRDARNTQ